MPPLLLVAVCILAMAVLSRHLAIISFAIIYRYAITVFLITTGIVIATTAVISFRKASTTADPRTPSKASKLVIVGIYKYSRNPMYLGLVLILLGLATMFATLSAFLVIPIFIGFIVNFQIKPEELALEKLFAANYRTYKIKVRRWL